MANILLITDYDDAAKTVLEKLVLLRDDDKILVCRSKDAKKQIELNSPYVVILHEHEDETSTLKAIKSLKEFAPNCEIVLLLNDTNGDLVIKAYDEGIYDYFYLESESYEILIKMVNCFKMQMQKEENSRNEKFLYQLGVIDSKTNMYLYKHLKEIFMDISDCKRIQKGCLILLTLDDRIKTKVSTNRLAQTIRHSIRKDDTAAAARGGKFYLILQNINIDGAKCLVEKIQNKMGKEYKVHAGLVKIGLKPFDMIDKLAKDSLESAIQDDELVVCLKEGAASVDSWLEDDETSAKKEFKLFQIAHTNKINNVITPLFYRFQKECEVKLTNTQVSQYANYIESVFSLKNEFLHSELVIRYNGRAKFIIEITHSGLDSPENYKTEIPLKEMTEKYLKTLLKRLKEEYKQTAYLKGE